MINNFFKAKVLSDAIYGIPSLQTVKHSKFAEGIEQSVSHNPKLLPPGVDVDSVSTTYYIT